MGLFDKFADIIRENDDDEFDDFYEEISPIRCPRRPSGKNTTKA